MIIDKKADRTLYVMMRKELKKFHINELMPGDVLVIRRSMKADSPSDYFVHITFNSAKVTMRCDLRELYDYQMPRYIRYLTEDIKVRLHYLRRSKFRVGDIVRHTDRKRPLNKMVCNIIANADGNVFYALGNKNKRCPKRLFPEDALESVVRNITPYPCA